MTRFRWDRSLHRILSAQLEPLGFRIIRPLCYARKTQHCAHILNFGGRVQRGTFKFTCMVGIQFPEIESLLRPGVSVESYPTVVIPFHFLYESRQYFEWEASTPEDLDVVAKGAVEEILLVATPFFERYSSLESVEQALKGPDAYRTFTLGAHQRAGVLAAIALHNARPDESRAIIADAMADPINAAPGMQRRLEELREQLLGAGVNTSRPWDLRPGEHP